MELRELASRYDRPGPRYTSYPTVPEWSDAFDADALGQALGRVQGPDLSVYVHVPFCERLCAFCACNRVITQDHGRAAPFLDALETEAELMARALVAGGVPEDAIECISDERAAVDAALHGALPGDLVVLFADALQRTWDQIVDFQPDSGALPAEPVAAPIPALPELPDTDADIGEGQTLIRDERGVRLAREIDD